MKTAFINGEYTSEPLISPYDLGFLRGFGVFESFRTYDQAPLFLERRLQRLRHSASEIGFEIPYSNFEIEEIIAYLIKENAFSESNFRIIATKGISHEGISPEGESSLYILTRPFTPYTDSYYQEGIRVATTQFSRYLPHIKTLNYLPGLLALEKAKSQGASEVLYYNKHQQLLEGSTSNFFGIKGETLFTAHDQILPGITREIVLESIKNHFEVVFEPIELSEIDQLDEAFITSSLREVVPVIQIDDQIVGSGRPGPHTEIILDLFRSALFELSLD